MDDWTWDITLFEGAAPHYERGRLPYAPGLADAVARLHPGAVGEGRMLDVGCGPGTLSLRLRQLFDDVVGVDPDPGMIAEARRRATDAGVTGVAFLQTRAEDLPRGLGTFDVAMFGQSFHWMDRDRVAVIVRGMLRPDGVWIHVSDRKDAEAAADPSPSRAPAPPYGRIGELVRAYLGPVRRAGRGVLLHGTPGGEAQVMARNGFIGPQRVIIPAGPVQHRTPEDIIAWVHSRSDAAPALFGDALGAFDAELRSLLDEAAPDGHFAERVPDTELAVWHTS